MGHFHPVNGYAWYGYIAGTVLAFVVLIAVLHLGVPQRMRRYVIMGITFIGGLFYSLEFFWPTHPMPTRDNPTQTGNFLTHLIVPFANISTVIIAMTVGLGVINLFQVHGKRLTRGGENSFNSFMFFLAMFSMTIINVLQQAHPNAINKNLNLVLFTGGYVNLDATMFSIIAFYIVSAAYRAFRVRSVEASLLLCTAVLVMLGQTALGQALTSMLPKSQGPLLHNLRVEVIRDWILNKASTPAVRAINFGLGVGSLAVALRIWLGLERGSYFDSNV